MPRPKRADPLTPVVVRFPPDELARFDAHCGKLGVNRTDAIRYLANQAVIGDQPLSVMTRVRAMMPEALTLEVVPEADRLPRVRLAPVTDGGKMRMPNQAKPGERLKKR